MSRVCSRGHAGKAVDGVCPVCLRIAQEEAEVHVYEPEEFVHVVDTTGDIHPTGEWE
jgi:hypothetical protein